MRIRDEIQKKDRPLLQKWLPPLCRRRYPMLTPSQKCPKRAHSLLRMGKSEHTEKSN